MSKKTKKTQKVHIYFSPGELIALQVGLETVYDHCIKSQSDPSINWTEVSRNKMLEIQKNALTAASKITRLTGTPFNGSIDRRDILNSPPSLT